MTLSELTVAQLSQGLAARRFSPVDVVEAYRTVIPPEAAADAHEIFGDARKPDWITFTSSSTVKNLLRLVQPEDVAGVKIASIGPVTSETARQFGLEVTVQAEEFTIDGLVGAVSSLAAPRP